MAEPVCRRRHAFEQRPGLSRIARVLRRGAAICAVLALSLPEARASDPAGQGGWQKLETGLDLAQFQAPIPSALGDSKIAVLRIDPGQFRIELFSARALNLAAPLTIGGWLKEQNLIAAINAGMFEPGGATVGHGRSGSVLLNPGWKENYGALLALDPGDPKLAPAAILDSACEDLKAADGQYRTVLQSMRMIDCKGANVWKKSEKIWSAAALAVDGEGRVLFIQARSPWDMHDFIENLQRLPLGIARAMYLEGGPEASLGVRAGGVSLEAVGSYETGFNENDANTRQWELPNVIGVTRKDVAR